MIKNSKIEKDLKEQFALFSQNNKKISLQQLRKWFIQAGIGDELITADMEKIVDSLGFKTLDYDTFEGFLTTHLAKNIEERRFQECLEQLVSCGSPHPVKTTHIVKVKRVIKK